MDKNNANISLSGSQKSTVTGRKSLIPATQGVTTSHGVKLSVNMTSDDKKKFLLQLEEWRKSKKEKIAASMLAKQKQAEKPKMSLPVPALKSKPVKNSGVQGRQSVFERLYKNEKIKKPENQISRESSSEATKPVPCPVSDKIKKTETQSVHELLSDQIKITKTQPAPQPIDSQIESAEISPSAQLNNDQNENVEDKASQLIFDQNENAERKPFLQTISEQNEIPEDRPSQIINEQDENVENKLTLQQINEQNENVEIKPSPQPVNVQIETAEVQPSVICDKNKEADTKPASQAISHEVKIPEINSAPCLPFDQNGNTKIKATAHPVSSQMKSTVTKPASVSTSDQIKTNESKPVKSGLGKSSLPVRKVEVGNKKLILRRSLSMMFHQKRKEQNTLRRSVSTQNIPKLNAKVQKPERRTFQMLPPHPPVSETATNNKGPTKPAAFATPKNVKPLTSTHLRTKLEDWLKVNGHSLDGYRHLRCFGISDSDRFILATPARIVDESLENSVYATAPNTPLDDSNKENVTPPTVIRQVSLKEAENWLRELHRLIAELKYPGERCEEWLAAIRKKCTGCTQLPVYWECLAALDESKGDIKSAIADYETAIIKGGEVEAVGDSLAQLFDKMVIESEKRSKPKLEKGLDPKNIFKSTIIKFALQQKALKNLSSELEPGVRKQLYVATPVRRSTRIQTPAKSSEEFASLQTLTPEVRKNVTFKPNESLLLD